MDVKAYLKRIGYRGSLQPSAEVLHRLHKRHMLSVPFENLDVRLGRPIILSETALYDKIVKHHRGGFCYELNGFFAGLLRRIGFNVTLLSARVARKEGGFTPDFDHLTLLVQLRGRWLADVGFGDSFIEPKRLDTSNPQEERGKIYRIKSRGGGRLLSRFDPEKQRWEPQYFFSLRPRLLEDFEPRCLYQQTSPKSHFRKGRLCTLPTPTGRVTLTDTKFIVTRGNERAERPLKNPEEFDILLRREFGITLS